MDIAVNKFRLNTELLEYFQNSTVQQQFDRKKLSSSFSFPDGMHEMLNTAKLLSEYKSVTLQVAKIAKNIRKEMFACKHFKFAGSFPQNCQSTSVLYSLKLLIAMILGGLSDDINTQACLNIAQLILFNSNKIQRITGTHQVQNLLFLYISV